MQFNNKAKDLTIGLELELQIIDPRTQNLASKAKEFIRHIQNSTYKELIKPEITQSMIEINSSVHYKVSNLEKEIFYLSNYLMHVARKHDVVICGGGTHPFQESNKQKIFPTQRFRDLARKYGYLAKRYTIFSMHVHVGCSQADKAIALTHQLARYIPQFIALSASSPYYNGVKTGYDSNRVNVVNVFPLSGHIPAVKDWSEFMRYYNKMQSLEIVQSMKDFYWDIRPKPEFGTVEIRVCDMPLTLSKAAALTAYIQTIAYYLLSNDNPEILPEYYQTYMYNRFQASRFGFDGDFINPHTLERSSVLQDILKTIRTIKPYAKELGNYSYLRRIKSYAIDKFNDANHLKLLNLEIEEPLLESVVKEKCRAWKNSLKIS